MGGICPLAGGWSSASPFDSHSKYSIEKIYNERLIPTIIQKFTCARLTFWSKYHYRPTTDPLPTHYRPDTDPLPIRYRSTTDQIPIHYRSDSDPLLTRYQSATDQIPIRYRPDTYPLPTRYLSATDQIAKSQGTSRHPGFFSCDSFSVRYPGILPG
jgi:hypothetical protein